MLGYMKKILITGAGRFIGSHPIDFTPSYTFERGLEKTISWFINPKNLNRYKVDIYNV
jgi:hypothetical protein